ncbi:MAG: DUF4214 domain-containing protein [Pseudomonadota bacterium]
MAAPLTAAQMATAQTVSFSPAVLSYSLGQFLTSSYYRAESAGQTVGSLDKFHVIAGDTYMASKVCSSAAVVYDSAGNPLPVTTTSTAPGFFTPNVSFIAAVTGDYYVDPQWDATGPNAKFDALMLYQYQSTTLAAFQAAGPRAGDLAGTAGNDTVQGMGFLWGLGGNDALHITFDTTSGFMLGGDGLDTAVFSGPRSFYSSVARDSSGVTLVSHVPGQPIFLIGVERLQFADGNFAIDVDGTGGEAYRLYQAAFNRKPDAAGLGYQIATLDKGAALHDVAQSFVTSAEFANKYGSLDNTGFVTQLYANVLHRGPDAAGLAYHVNNLAHGAARADVLIGFSESAENQSALIGTESAGMLYIPWLG